MRLFVAVNLPPALRDRLYDATAPVRAAAPDVSWIRSELLHFTVKFLGEVDEAAVAPLSDGLGTAAARHGPFAVTLAAAGAFPNFARPRVVWIGVRDQRPLSALAEDVEQACALLGFEREARAFTAHLTLGRVRRVLSRPATQALERAARAVHNEYPLTVSAIDLMLSQTGPQGSRYTVLASMPLAGVETTSPRLS